MRLEILLPIRTMHKILYICRLGRQTKEAGSLKHKQLADYKNVAEKQGLPNIAAGGIFHITVRWKKKGLHNLSKANLLCHCHVTRRVLCCLTRRTNQQTICAGSGIGYHIWWSQCFLHHAGEYWLFRLSVTMLINNNNNNNINNNNNNNNSIGNSYNKTNKCANVKIIYLLTIRVWGSVMVKELRY